MVSEILTDKQKYLATLYNRLSDDTLQLQHVGMWPANLSIFFIIKVSQMKFMPYKKKIILRMTHNLVIKKNFLKLN